MVQPAFLRRPAPAGDTDQPLPVGRRSAARLRLAVPVRLVSTHGTAICVLLDLSRSGARIGLAEPLPPGVCVYLRIARLEVFAEVVRRHDGEGGGVNGLAFDEPLSEDAVLAVRHFAEGFAERERDALRDQVRRWVSGEIRR
jgi:hypothetical protein